ncbi:hypothetical protein HYC85_004586 [Camellia sinensis]|uniref:Uncharacterized protein n=1 Tax=Camellia sinensis TaxID=4442 RepID=A0A7J7HYN7_CAMSI|nr:hypothetical protein HYC85_004586 [Camellia sinensis]
MVIDFPSGIGAGEMFTIGDRGRGVLKHSDGLDMLLMALGTIGCVADGACMSAIMLVLANLMNGYAAATSLTPKVINTYALSLLYVAIGVGIGGFLGLVYGKLLSDVGEKIQEAYGVAGGIAEQALSSVRTVYSYVREETTAQSYSAALKPTLKLGFKQGLLKGMAIGSVGIGYGVWALQGCALGSCLINVKHFMDANVAAAQIFEMIERVPNIDSADQQGKIMSDVKGELEFKDLDFVYPSRPESKVLQNFNLKVDACQTVGLVGGSGSGKSTVINLLERFYDPLEGEILLDGISIKTLQLKWLRSQMGLVNQEPILFATSIKENILFGKEEASEEEIVQAAKAANAHNFITQLPNGYDTQVGQLGIKMSGGQKQRISIARALLRDPKILLLDEATSSLDSQSEKAVQDALNQASIGRTTIVIAHRLSTLRDADLIAVIQSGQVVECGSHDQLVQNIHGPYSAMCFYHQCDPTLQLWSYGREFNKKVRESTFAKIMTFEIEWFDQEDNSSGPLYSRLATDATMVRTLVADILALVTQAISSATLSIILGLVLAWKLALAAIAMQPLIISTFYMKAIMMRSMSKKILKAQNKSTTQIGPKNESLKQSWYAGFGLFVALFLTAANAGILFWYGGKLLYHKEIKYKNLFQTFFSLVSTGRIIAETGSMNMGLLKGTNALKSIFMILKRTSKMNPDKKDGINPVKISGNIELKEVDFFYPTRPKQMILTGLSLKIDAGKIVALVGQSGSGKSTIIRLIQRFYDPSKGSVEIDGFDIKFYNLRALRSHIAWVGQEPTIFAGSIHENIAYGKENVTEAEIIEASTLANAHEFISSMEEGYATYCGERGVQLSGGQKQRLALARAILKNPAILLLDEATSAIDVKMENLVQDALEKTMVGRTCLVVAHRLSTIQKSDKISVIDKGRVVEEGSHDELLSKGEKGAYHSLVRLQQQATLRFSVRENVNDDPYTWFALSVANCLGDFKRCAVWWRWMKSVDHAVREESKAGGGDD